MDGGPASRSDAFAFEHVSVTFGSATVLDGIDLRIPGHGITVVSGPSGSGKSTLTRLCNRLLDASTGVVRHRGRDVMDLDVLALRRSVGMVFQRPTLFDGSVRDNLMATGVQDPAAHVTVLDAVGLASDFLERAANTVSGGEAQRICLARTLLMHPEVLVADEPTASLDEASARSLEGLALDLASRDVPILWVTHDQAQAARIADHHVVLDHGRVATTRSTNGTSNDATNGATTL